ncbi:polysaccharide deacetylase family protein [Candidatus Margulisiibacteriota bacterium]
MRRKIIAIPKGIHIGFKPPQGWDSNIHMHYWGTQPNDIETTWPGIKMDNSGNGFFRGFLLGQYSAHIVFSDGRHHKTPDLFRNKNGWFIENQWWDYDPGILSQFTFPGGKQKALVMSFDDAGTQDRRLVKLLNQNNIKGTFHLNSDRLGDGLDYYLSSSEVQELFNGHEVSAHTIGHPSLANQHTEFIKYHVGHDRYLLEQLTGKKVRGMSYPFGEYDENVLRLLPGLGIEYARTVQDTMNFALPHDFLTWHPTSHHLNPKIFDLGKEFISANPKELSVFFIWGHSWELDNGKWDFMSDFCNMIGGKSDIWYAGALDIKRHIDAVSNLVYLEDKVFNPLKNND